MSKSKGAKRAADPNKQSFKAERIMVISGIVLLILGTFVLRVAPTEWYIGGLVILGFGVGAISRAIIEFTRSDTRKK